MHRLEPTLPDDLRLDRFGRLAGRGLDRIPRRSFQDALRCGREVLGQSLEVGQRGDAEYEADVACLVPAVKVLGLAEVGVTRRVMRSNPALRQRVMILSKASPAPSCEGRLPLRLIR